MTVERRFDFSRLASKLVVRTPSGGARIPAAMTRTGVFTYTNSDGTVRRELRLPEEVFSADSMASLRDAPLVVGHPDMIDPSNWEKLAVGHVSGDVKQDGHLLSGCVTVQKAEALKRIDSGELQELSCGYVCNFSPTPGTFEGQAYDGIQSNIRYNHLGLGPSNWARAGNEAALRLDSFWTDATIDGHATDIPVAAEPPLMKIRFDGKEYDRGSEDHVLALETKLDGQTTAVATATKSLDTLQAKFDAQAVELVTAQTAATTAADPKRLDAAINARVQLVVDAVKVLGTKANFDGKTDRDIRAEVVAITHPVIKLDGKSDDYVTALFEAGVLSGIRADGINALPGVLDAVESSDERTDADDKAEADAEEARQNRSKKPLAYKSGRQ